MPGPLKAAGFGKLFGGSPDGLRGWGQVPRTSGGYARHGLPEARLGRRHARRRHFTDALAEPSSVSAIWTEWFVHDESMDGADLHGSRGRTSTISMRPCLHSGHWRNEMPVSSSKRSWYSFAAVFVGSARFGIPSRRR